jgi:hypothetical protein
MKISFHGCLEYVEEFWNNIPEEKQTGVIYIHEVTAEDVAKFRDLEVGQLCHMMIEEVSPLWGKGLALVREAISDQKDDTELENKISELVAAGAVDVDEYGIVTTYEELKRQWIPENQNTHPDPITQINLKYHHKEDIRRLNKYFIKEAIIFTKEELDLIKQYKELRTQYREMMKRKQKG